jgi:hypothetical protein
MVSIKNFLNHVIIYFKVGLDLMMKLLYKDPKKRIAASKALEHPFFEEEEIFKELVENRRREMQKLF